LQDRRRFAKSAYRLQENHKRHRTAIAIYEANPNLVVSIEDNKWQVYNKESTKSSEVTYEGPCTCDSTKNTHCLNCGVCAYAWSCTCLDNRSGICCAHRHAVRILNPDRLPVETLATTSQVTVSSSSEVDLGEPITPAQERREARYQKLGAIRSAYAVIDGAATVLAKDDTDEAMQHLEEILCYMQLAAKVAQPSPSSSLAARPEMTQSGGKPQLTKMQLYQRGKGKKSKEPTQDLHEELRQLRGLEGDANGDRFH
ncbi:hypothetical protein COOONC_14956, partial [Cooperia oncophora]